MATPMVHVDTIPLGSDTHSWVLTSEGTTLHNGEVIATLKEKPSEGDILVSGWWLLPSVHVCTCTVLHTILYSVYRRIGLISTPS